MSALGAFLRRDWQIHSSYRAGLLMSAGSALFALVPFFFIGRMVDPLKAETLAPYGGAYFPFVLLGLVCSRYLSTMLTAVGAALREEQIQGSLEAMMSTPASLAVLAAGGALWPLVWTTVEAVLYVGLGMALFGFSLQQVNGTAFLAVFLLLLASLGSLGLLSACGLLLFKEADPVAWVFGGLMRLLSGVYFPVVLLPGWLKQAAEWLPLTPALEAMRQAVLAGKPVSMLGREMAALGLFAAVGWPLAIAAFIWTLRRLKQTGALTVR